MWSIAATRRGRYRVRVTWNGATVARDQYGAKTWSIASRDAMDEEELLPLETSIDVVLHSNCTNTEQEYILLHQPDIGIDNEKKLPLLHNKPLFARSSRVLRRSDSNKGRQLGLPSRTSGWIGIGHSEPLLFWKERNVCRMYCCACFSLCVSSAFYCVYFSRLVRELPEQVRKMI